MSGVRNPVDGVRGLVRCGGRWQTAVGGAVGESAAGVTGGHDGGWWRRHLLRLRREAVEEPEARRGTDPPRPGVSCSEDAVAGTARFRHDHPLRKPSEEHRNPRQGLAQPRACSEELESALDEVLVELEDAAVAGVWVDDELAVGESSVQVDGVLGGHHLVVVTVGDEDRLVDGREVRGLLQSPAVDGLELGAERAHGDRLVAVVRSVPRDVPGIPCRLGSRSEFW